jgi:23S rRNA pseudouridine1911/1915/1917 synthase
VNLNILYEDREILVVEKPAGVAVQTGSINNRDLVSEIKNYLCERYKKTDPYLGIIHRLDQPVGGILVFALNKKAAASLSRQISAGVFNKKYCAHVEGIIDTGDEWKTSVDYLVKEKEKALITDKENKKAKRAELKYKTVKIDREKEMTLLDIELITGRFHQIRVQLSGMGHPIEGDIKYGGKKSRDDRSISLYAYSLVFSHPVSGKKMEYFLDRDIM